MSGSKSKVKGIVYLSASMGWIDKDLATIRSDLWRMHHELHANAIRLEGCDERLWAIAELAKAEGLQVWLHPKATAVPPKSEFLVLEEECARRAKGLVDVYLLGNELSLEVNLWDGRTLQYTERDMRRDVIGPLDRNPDVFRGFLRDLLRVARGAFPGPIGYVAGSWEFEHVERQGLDVVLCNRFLYPPAERDYAEHLLQMKRFGKPAILSECGYQTIDKAYEAGPLYAYPLEHEVRYDEEAQAACLGANLEHVRRSGLEGVFVHEWQAALFERDDAGSFVPRIHDESFGIVRADGRPKLGYNIVAAFFSSFE